MSTNQRRKEEEGGKWGRGRPYPCSSSPSRTGAWDPVESGSGGAPGYPNACPRANRTIGKAGGGMGGTHDCRRGRTREAQAHMGTKEGEENHTTGMHHGTKGDDHGCTRNASGHMAPVCRGNRWSCTSGVLTEGEGPGS